MNKKQKDKREFYLLAKEVEYSYMVYKQALNYFYETNRKPKVNIDIDDKIFKEDMSYMMTTLNGFIKDLSKWRKEIENVQKRAR